MRIGASMTAGSQSLLQARVKKSCGMVAELLFVQESLTNQGRLAPPHQFLRVQLIAFYNAKDEQQTEKGEECRLQGACGVDPVDQNRRSKQDAGRQSPFRSNAWTTLLWL